MSKKRQKNNIEYISGDSHKDDPFLLVENVVPNDVYILQRKYTTGTIYNMEAQTVAVFSSPEKAAKYLSKGCSENEPKNLDLIYSTMGNRYWFCKHNDPNTFSNRYKVCKMKMDP